MTASSSVRRPLLAVHRARMPVAEAYSSSCLGSTTDNPMPAASSRTCGAATHGSEHAVKDEVFRVRHRSSAEIGNCACEIGTLRQQQQLGFGQLTLANLRNTPQPAGPAVRCAAAALPQGPPGQPQGRARSMAPSRRRRRLLHCQPQLHPAAGAGVQPGPRW